MGRGGWNPTILCWPATRPGARGCRRQRRVEEEMGRIAEAEFLYLTTTGRRSGMPREIEIWFTRVDGRYYVIAEHGARAQWVRNIRAESRVRVRVGEAAVAAAAQVRDPTAKPDLQAAVQGLFPREERLGRWPHLRELGTVPVTASNSRKLPKLATSPTPDGPTPDGRTVRRRGR